MLKECIQITVKRRSAKLSDHKSDIFLQIPSDSRGQGADYKSDGKQWTPASTFSRASAETNRVFVAVFSQDHGKKRFSLSQNDAISEMSPCYIMSRSKDPSVAAPPAACRARLGPPPSPRTATVPDQPGNSPPMPHRRSATHLVNFSPFVVTRLRGIQLRSSLDTFPLICPSGNDPQISPGIDGCTPRLSRLFAQGVSFAFAGGGFIDSQSHQGPSSMRAFVDSAPTAALPQGAIPSGAIMSSQLTTATVG